MNRFTRTAALSLLLLTGLAACSKKSEDFDIAGTGPVRVSTLSAIVRGAQWTAEEAVSYGNQDTLWVGGKRVTDIDPSALSILIVGYHGEGVYPLDSNLNAGTCFYDNLLYNTKGGELRVTLDNEDRLSGNFHMNIESDYGATEVTDGQFTFYKQ